MDCPKHGSPSLTLAGPPTLNEKNIGTSLHDVDIIGSNTKLERVSSGLVQELKRLDHLVATETETEHLLSISEEPLISSLNQEENDGFSTELKGLAPAEELIQPQIEKFRQLDSSVTEESSLSILSSTSEQTVANKFVRFDLANNQKHENTLFSLEELIESDPWYTSQDMHAFKMRATRAGNKNYSRLRYQQAYETMYNKVMRQLKTTPHVGKQHMKSTAEFLRLRETIRNPVAMYPMGTERNSWSNDFSRHIHLRRKKQFQLVAVLNHNKHNDHSPYRQEIQQALHMLSQTSTIMAQLVASAQRK